MLHWLTQFGNSISSTCDDWCLHLWEVVGVWFTGTATFAAVVVSLMLASRKGIRLEVSARVMLIIDPGAEPPYPEVLFITVRNVGTRTAKITGAGWRHRPWGRRHAYQQFNLEGYSGPPATIKPGNDCDFTLPLSNPGCDWEVSFLEKVVGRWPRVGVHLVRVIAWTPAGQQCSAPLDSSLKQGLVERADAIKQKPPNASEN